MRKLGMMVLILFGTVTLLGNNYALAKGPHGRMSGKAHFDVVDTNNDGKLSREEYVGKCEKRFNAMDTNKDGFVTREESPKGWHEHKEKMTEKVKKGHSHGHPSTPPSETMPAEN